MYQAACFFGLLAGISYFAETIRGLGLQWWPVLILIVQFFVQLVKSHLFKIEIIDERTNINKLTLEPLNCLNVHLKEY